MNAKGLNRFFLVLLVLYTKKILVISHGQGGLHVHVEQDGKKLCNVY